MDADDEDLWVFGYGSLMWRPGFAYAERHPATLTGFRRALCLYSYEHRGTIETPGIVAGLDLGGECQGMAFRVEAADRGEVHAYLRARELNRYCYRETWCEIALQTDDGPSSRLALAYVVDRAHPQYCGELDLETKTRLVLQGNGISGTSLDYLESLVASLEDLGIDDPDLVILRDTVRQQRSLTSGVSREN